MLAGTDRGISRMKPGGTKLKVEQLNTTNGLPDNIVRVSKGVAGTQRVWIGMQEAGVALLEDTGNKQLSVKSFRAQWSWGQVNDILPLSEQEAWAVTEAGYLLHVTLSEIPCVLFPNGCLVSSYGNCSLILRVISGALPSRDLQRS